MTPQEFANKIRTKYPNGVSSDGRKYTDIPDVELTQKVIAKYPEYSSQVSLPTQTTAVGSPVQTTTNDVQGFVPPGIQTAKDLSTGIAQGLISTITGIGKLGKSAATGLGGVIGINEAKPIDSTGAFNKAQEIATPTNTTQSIGKGIEQIAEFFIPAGKAARVEEAVNLIAKGIKSPVLSFVTKVLGKSAVQGVSGGLVSLAQTGDIKEAAQTGLTAAVTRGTMATIGEGARALKLPERMYSTIFKNSANDMISELKAGGIENLKQNNPTRYNEFVKQGIIKVDKSGNPVVNDTLAEQALDKGLRGSIRNMANEVVDGTLSSEAKALDIAKNYQGTVDMSEPQIKNVLNKIGTDYEDVGFGEISNQAKAIVSKIEESGGKVSAETALNARRLLDKVRISTSFDKPVTSLSQTQGNLKTLADTIRSRVNSIPGMGETMKNYTFYIDALESLAKEAARRGNSQVVGLIDAAFLSGIPTDPATAGTMSILQKLLRSPYGLTKLAQFINSSNLGTKASGVLTSGSAGVQSSLTNQ